MEKRMQSEASQFQALKRTIWLMLDWNNGTGFTTDE